MMLSTSPELLRRPSASTPLLSPLINMPVASSDSSRLATTNPTIGTTSSTSSSPSRPRGPDGEVAHIWIIIGPAGSGKTTVAQGLAHKFDLPFLEGDDYHSPENKRKMAANEPLTDADRWDWLIRLREAAIESLPADGVLSPSSSPSGSQSSASASPTPAGPPGVVVACSALKRKYRDVIRVAAYGHRLRVRFVYLKLSADELVARVQERARSEPSHYMHSTMVESQVRTMEEPSADELSMDAAIVDGQGPISGVLEGTVKAAGEMLQREEREREGRLLGRLA